MKRKSQETVKPKKIMDSDQRKQLQLAYLEETKITNRVFELLDLYVNRKSSQYKKGFERAPDWLRPIAALSFRIGVDHEAVQEAVKAGTRQNWDLVDLLLMAYEP